MHPPLRALLLALVLGALCAFAVACGEEQEGLLSSSQAEQLKERLDRIDNDVLTESCEALDGHLAGLKREIDDLPNTVDTDLRRTLRDGQEHLERTAPAECRPDEPRTTTTTTTPTETIPTTPTEPPATTPTEPPATTPTEPPATTPTEPPTTTPPQTTPPEEVPPGDSGGEEAPEGEVTP